ncbi:MAG: YceI family protein [Patescibacteria group bacterium]
MKKIFFPVLFLSLFFLAGCGIAQPDEGTVPAGKRAASEIAAENFADADTKTLGIVAAESQAKFSLNEVLKGVPTLVVGTSSQLSGMITVKTSQPAAINIGAIQLDATSLVTDNALRNKNIIELILKSNEPQNRYIVFQPTNISGVPETLTPGQSFPVTIEGNMTISGNTQPTTFTGAITWQSDGTLTGTATTDLTYANFGLAIPDFPFFSDVDKVTKLEINLKASPIAL